MGFGWLTTDARRNPWSASIAHLSATSAEHQPAWPCSSDRNRDGDMNYDVIVVGAGPAGATTAHDLARRGVRVGLFEQAKIPRYKPCGGCLSLKIDKILDPDFHSLIERTVYGATFTFAGLDEVRVRSDRPIAYMVMRDRFDHFLATKAQQAGATLHEGERILRVSETSGRVSVTTPRGEYRASYLVGADGANGVVARQLGLTPKRRLAVCVEAEVTTRNVTPPVILDEVRIEFGAVPFGYGWVFPKGDHLSIGVGGLKHAIGNPRPFYDEFLVDQNLVDSIIDERRRGYIIPVFAGGREAISGSRTLLVGDAAALVDPFLGEGVYYAIRSGQIAADVLNRTLADEAEGSFEEYHALIEQHLYREFRPALTTAFFLYSFRRPAFEILKRRHALVNLYFDVLRGEASHVDRWRDLRRYAAGGLVRSLWPSRKATSVAAHYNRVAPQYDAQLRLWRSLVVAPALDGLRLVIADTVPDGATVLDAGTGTGDATRLVLESANPGRVIAVDLSKRMLLAARKKITDARVTWDTQDITKLPYPDRSFDAVVSTWTLETLPDPRAAVTEWLRVIKDDGWVIYAFSSKPSAGLERLYARLLEEWSSGTLRARFVSESARPYHQCEGSRLMTFGHQFELSRVSWTAS